MGSRGNLRGNLIRGNQWNQVERRSGEGLESVVCSTWFHLITPCLVWGTRGPEFESRRPDLRNARSRGLFVFRETTKPRRGLHNGYIRSR